MATATKISAGNCLQLNLRWIILLSITNQEVKKEDVPLIMKRNGKMVKVNTKTSSHPIAKADSLASANLKQYTSPKKNIAATVSLL